MSSVLSTSTMKSPPLVVWVCGSFWGGEVSRAVWIGPGATALRCGAVHPVLNLQPLDASKLAFVGGDRMPFRSCGGVSCRPSGKKSSGRLARISNALAKSLPLLAQYNLIAAAENFHLLCTLLFSPAAP